MLKTKNFPRTKYRQGALYINEDEITKALEPKSFFFFILFFFFFAFLLLVGFKACKVPLIDVWLSTLNFN